MVQPDLPDQIVSDGLRVEPLTPTLGARLRDIDLADLDEARFDRLYAAWLEYKVLFVNPTNTTRIDGLAQDISARLLDEVYRHCARPEFACRFRWRAGKLAIRDSRDTIHYADIDYDGQRRCLYRTTIAGEVPLPA